MYVFLMMLVNEKTKNVISLCQGLVAAVIANSDNIIGTISVKYTFCFIQQLYKSDTSLNCPRREGPCHSSSVISFD